MLPPTEGTGPKHIARQVDISSERGREREREFGEASNSPNSPELAGPGADRLLVGAMSPTFWSRQTQATVHKH